MLVALPLRSDKSDGFCSAKTCRNRFTSSRNSFTSVGETYVVDLILLFPVDDSVHFPAFGPGLGVFILKALLFRRLWMVSLLSLLTLVSPLTLVDTSL